MLVVLAALALAACDDDQVTTAGSEPPASTAPSGSTSTDPPETSTPPAPVTTVPEGELPGERIEIFPYPGAQLAVVGVAADDVLNVRAGPGTEYPVLVGLGPLTTGVAATGHNRSVPEGGIWALVTGGGATGWANVSFLAQLGATRDVTTEIAPSPADLPGADTMLELGQLVAGARIVPMGEGGENTIVSGTSTVVDGPHVGDLGEITIDLLGFQDDAILGERLHVFATPGEGGEAFVLKSVEATDLCRRAVDAGLCV